MILKETLSQVNNTLAELELSKEQFFVIEQKAKTIRIPLRQTLAFQSDRRKVLALVEGETIDFYGKIDDVIRELPSYFIRIHNRCIVNLNYVTTLEKDRCIMGKYAFPISRTFRQELEIAFARAMLKH